MSIMKLYAGTTTPLTQLPSPVSVQITEEQIWDENTGRVASGSMEGSPVATKMTYAIKWGVLKVNDTSDALHSFKTISDNMPNGFFFFGTANNSTTKYYRSEITYDVIQVGSTTYYKDVSVSVIQK